MEKENAGVSLAFDARAVAPVAMFRDKHTIRYFLHGLYICPHPEKGVYIVATDGHRMAMWHDQDGRCDKGCILRVTPAFINAAKKRIPASLKGNDIRVTVESGRLTLGAWDGDTMIEELFVQAGKFEIDGLYPDIWSVIPTEQEMAPGMHGALNRDYLADLGQVSKLLKPRCGIRLESAVLHFSRTKRIKNGEPIKNGEGHIVSRFIGSEQFMVITMPMRMEAHECPNSALPPTFVRPMAEQ